MNVNHPHGFLTASPYCALSCYKTRIDLASSSLRWRIFSRFAHGSTFVQPLFVADFSPLQGLFSRASLGLQSLLFTCCSWRKLTCILFRFCSYFVRYRGGVLDCSSPVHGDRFRVLRLSFKGGFLSVRSLFDRASASPPAAWSQAQIFSRPGGLDSLCAVPSLKA